jgi:cytoskeleton protein RodZ
MSNFGANFRKAREAAGLPLEKIAAETRISTRFLTAIENETFQLLPGGIFNRGFIRAYAEYLGLDSDQAVADYDRMSSSADQEPVDVLREADPASPRNVDWTLYPIAAAVLLLLLGAYYFVTRKPSTAAPAAEPVAVAQQAPEPADDVAPAPALTAPPQPAETAPAATTAQKTTVPPPATPKPAPPVVPSTPSSDAALAVNVNVTESTWVKVTTDGTLALSELLEAGAARRFSASQSMDVVIGNAAGATMQINGRDLGQLGASGKVREFKITPENAGRIR